MSFASSVVSLRCDKVPSDVAAKMYATTGILRVKMSLALAWFTDSRGTINREALKAALVKGD